MIEKVKNKKELFRFKKIDSKTYQLRSAVLLCAGRKETKRSKNVFIQTFFEILKEAKSLNDERYKKRVDNRNFSKVVSLLLCCAVLCCAVLCCAVLCF